MGTKTRSPCKSERLVSVHLRNLRRGARELARRAELGHLAEPALGSMSVMMCVRIVFTQMKNGLPAAVDLSTQWNGSALHCAGREAFDHEATQQQHQDHGRCQRDQADRHHQVMENEEVAN
jgi:hypothetical protein